jgi:CubicO group peptidase (beta-lactamase class C family)
MSNPLSPLGGFCSTRLAPLRELFAEKLDSGEELGASVAVITDGKTEADFWGGWTDTSRTIPWGENTITNVFSTTKPMIALAALTLVECQVLDLDAPVSAYWPEFAEQGKSEIRIRHLLSHTSGVSGWDKPIALEDLYDWERSTTRLAAQKPWWEPGTAAGYHALSYGHLIGEVIRRVTGLLPGRYFASHIAEPLRADFHIGLPTSEFPRVAPVVPPKSFAINLSSLDPNSPARKTHTGPANQARASWTEAWRRADIAAANGHGNARSVAWVQSAVSCGGLVGERRLLSPGTIDRIFEVQSDGVDLVLGSPIRWGLGYCLAPCPDLLPGLPTGRICTWGGWGGSLVLNDADRRFTFAYVMNRMAPGLIGAIATELVMRLYRILEN